MYQDQQGWYHNYRKVGSRGHRDRCSVIIDQPTVFVCTRRSYSRSWDTISGTSMLLVVGAVAGVVKDTWLVSHFEWQTLCGQPWLVGTTTLGSD